MSQKKVIYLDQNKWIELAKAILNKPGSERFEDVKNKILEKVKNEEWVFPLSIIHHIETMSRLDTRSRIELAKVMGEISCNYSILPYIYIDKAEFQNSLRKVYDLEPVDFKNEVISKDFVKAVGLDGKSLIISGVDDPMMKEEMERFARRILDSHNMFYEFMQLTPIIELVTSLQRDNDFYVAEYEKMRSHYIKIPKEHRYSMFIVNNYIEGYKKELLEFHIAMHRIGIPKEKMFPEKLFATKESTLDFLESIPSFAIQIRLTYEIINNVSRNFDKNDFKDIAFLSTAVPYCDVVITERLWVDLIKRNKLDVRYNTFVTSSLNDLLNY
ncbi:hypothetical protein JCM14036_30970 [Desulfotomaculum defluvii]